MTTPSRNQTDTPAPAHPTAPPVPHHFVITVDRQNAKGRVLGAMTREGIAHWQHGETRQDQYRKVCQFIAHELTQDGYSAHFVTTFWDLAPNTL